MWVFSLHTVDPASVLGTSDGFPNQSEVCFLRLEPGVILEYHSIPKAILKRFQEPH